MGIWLPSLVIAFLLLGEASGAQAIALSGVVRGEEGGAPIGQATVRIEGTSSVSLSNDQGRYEAVVPESLANRTISLSARIIGYSSSRVLVPIADSSMHRDLALESCPLSVRNPGDPAERFAPTPSLASLTQAAGLNDLRRATNPVHPEVRVWIWRSDESPFDLYRFVEHDGKKTGEHISSTWGAHRCMYESRHDDACGRPSLTGTLPNVGDLFICRRVDPVAEDWSGRWKDIDSIDVSGLLRRAGSYDSQAVKRNPHFLTIESWDGNRYRVGSYELHADADTLAHTPAERLANLLEKIP